MVENLLLYCSAAFVAVGRCSNADESGTTSLAHTIKNHELAPGGDGLLATTSNGGAGSR